MKSFVLVRHGAAENAFELREGADLVPAGGQVLIEVAAFGLNYADIMARTGKYKDAPPLPSVIGYEAAGVVKALGAGVTNLQVGQRVAAFLRFGGYATQVLAPADGVIPIPDSMDWGTALALTVQYCTAWYAAEECMRMHEGDHVLIQAAAGGVGIALVQMAKRRGAIVYGTAGSDSKIEYLRSIGVDHPINYNKVDWFAEIKRLRGDKGVDVVFDSLGGAEFKRGYKALGPGGRIAGFGNASRSQGWANIFGDLKTLFGFGFYSPAFLLMQSRSIIGVNMLRIGDYRPMVLKSCLHNTFQLAAEGVFKPLIGAEFSASQLVEAHEYLQKRKSMGKIVVKW